MSASRRATSESATTPGTAPRFLDGSGREICGRRRRRRWEIGKFRADSWIREGTGKLCGRDLERRISERISLFSRNFCGFVDSVRVCLGLCGAFAGLWQEGEKPYANCDFQRSDVSSLSPVTVDILSGFFFKLYPIWL